MTSDCVDIPSAKEDKQVLGLDWNVIEDEFVYNFDKFLTKCEGMNLTKRNILSVASSFYDPLGCISPVTARIKVIFQLLCKNKLDWDDEVSDDLKLIWFELLQALRDLKTVKLERYVCSNATPFHVELHGFCDSSLEVYCAVAYLRIVSDEGVEVKFLCAKTKVAPLKALTIPRLELLSCLLLSTLLSECKLALQTKIKIDRTLCWSDSEVALCWIKGKERIWKPWVENRVVKIRKVADRDCWFHVAGTLNPADRPTRMCKNLNELFSGDWFEGPVFLRKLSIDIFPFQPDDTLKLVHVFAESKRKGNTTATLSTFDTLVATCASEHVKFTEILGPVKVDCSPLSLSKVLFIERFSSLKKLVTTFAYVRRFIHNVRMKVLKKDELLEGDIITAEEFEQSLSTLIRFEQFHLQAQSNYEKLKSSLKLFTDAAGFIRLKGRFGESTMTFQEQCPILLRSSVDSHITRLLIWEAHERVYHNGIEATLARIRQKYWLYKGRKSVKDILRRCVICKKFQGRALLPPMSPDLPYYRVDYMMSPFNTTGLDFAGPLYIRDSSSKAKVYILLFTCSSSRAIHLELVQELSSASFINAFRRFGARRGYPRIVVHDNAKTFTAVGTKLFFATNAIKSKPILPLSPWWGGFYERLVRSVKLPLLKVAGKALLSFEELNTVICEIEMIINCRPLVYTSEDDLRETLTPFHLMYGRDISKREYFGPSNGDFLCADYSNRYRYLQKILNGCWNRFLRTYLQELRQHHIYRKDKTQSNVKLYKDDVVLLMDDKLQSRNTWKKGIIDEVIYGKDSQPRGVKLSTISKTGLRSPCYRPIQKIIPFEITNRCEEKATITPNCEVDNNDIESGENRVSEDRPKRKTAIEGQELRRLREKYY